MARLLSVALILAGGPGFAHPGDDADVSRLSAQLAVAPAAPVYLQRAEKLRLLRRFDEAISDLAQAERLGASMTDTALFRGLALADQGKDAAALVELDRYFARGGASSLALRTRAGLHSRHGRLDHAADDLARAVRQGAGPEVCLELADAEEARGRAADATRGLEQCLGALKGAVTVRKRLIEVCVRQRDFTRAVELARAAMVGLPIKAEWRLVAADALDAAGKNADARLERLAALDELDRVLASRGGGLQQLLRARALVGLGRHAEARAQLDALPELEDAQKLRAQLVARTARGRTP